MRTVPADAEFVIFVGDLRSASPTKPCVKEEYTSVASLFRLSHAPVFAIIGDNDWSDCPNIDEGLHLWRNEFVGFESKYWAPRFTILRQSGYPDNFAFLHKGTQFIGLNIIGGDTRNATEWQNRLTDEVEWTMELMRSYKNSNSGVGRVVVFGHADPGPRHRPFFQPLATFIKSELNNTMPFLYVNGDGHKWAYNSSYRGQASWLRVMVTGFGDYPLLKVSVTADGLFHPPEEAFVLDRRL